MKTKEELNTLKDENQALSANELAQVTGGVINIKDKEDISGGMSGTSGYLVVGGGGQSGGAGEMHFPNNENGLEETKDPAKRLGF